MNMLALTIILPLIGFVLLAFSRGRWSENLSATIGVGSVGLAAFGDSVCRDGFLRQRQTGVQPAAVDVDVGR
ncbi:NADH dehydrogenase I chain L [Salmonella sp. NCTC 11881]|nr:NADH dehydrogenase I chain L [Salmonella sp. NCTC 11881]